MTDAKRIVMREMPITNAERMYALDEAWNARDWDTFDFFHDVLAGAGQVLRT